MLHPNAAEAATEEFASAEYRQDGSSPFDFREIYAAVFRARYILFGIIFGCVVIGIAATLLMTRKYEGVASVEVRQEAEKVLGTEADRESASSKIDVERFLDTQLDLVRSRLVTIAVAEELGLFRAGFLETMNIDATPEQGDVLSEQEARRELVIKTLLDNLEVGFTGQTRILMIRFTSPDARLSAKIANSYATNYIKSNLERKSESSSYALNFLRGQLNEAQVRLEESERASLEYARRTRIVDASNAARSSNGSESNQPQSLITAQLVQLNEAYSAAVAARVAAEQRWRRTSAMPLLNIPEVLANQAIQGLLEQRAIVESQYKEQLETRKPEFPAVRQAAARLQEIDRQLNALSRNIRGSVESQYQVARNQELQLQKQLDDLKSRTLVEQNQSIQLSILRREADTNRQQYEALLRRFNQLNAESGVQANNLGIVDRAVPKSKPSSPKLLLNLALALIAGFALSALYILAQMHLFDRIRTSFDVTERLGLPMLGVIPTADNVIEEMADQKSAIAESFNLVRTGLSLSSEDGIPATAMVTSTQASEGKTSCCVSLAMAFSRLGKRVLLIDLDLRRPNVHRLLALSNKVGASSVLSGQISAIEAIQPTQFADLKVMTAGPIPPSPTDLIMGQQLDILLAELGKSFDLILIDSPPVLALADAEILSSRLQATMFVVESGRNSRKSVLNATSRIMRNGAKVAGVILTKYDAGEMGYGYSADYAYVYQYGSRKGDNE